MQGRSLPGSAAPSKFMSLKSNWNGQPGLNDPLNFNGFLPIPGVVAVDPQNVNVTVSYSAGDCMDVT